MSPTIAECLEHARQCEWYAARFARFMKNDATIAPVNDVAQVLKMFISRPEKISFLSTIRNLTTASECRTSSASYPEHPAPFAVRGHVLVNTTAR